MKLKLYQIDAFTEEVFEGNPAAVIPLKEWLSDDIMLKIAIENNLSETAFFVPINNGFHLRWFTPGGEVDLCGHATLATAHVLYNHLDYNKKEIQFESRSGILKVKKVDGELILDFPTSIIKAIEVPEQLKSAFNISPQSCIQGRDDLMLVFENESDILNLKPDYRLISQINTRGVIVTSKSNQFDFISRFFAPTLGIDEDPVTGSAHTMLIPYWAKQLNKNQFVAKQVSPRGGVLHCKYLGERVEIGGQAVTYLIGEISI